MKTIHSKSHTHTHHNTPHQPPKHHALIKQATPTYMSPLTHQPSHTHTRLLTILLCIRLWGPDRGTCSGGSSAGWSSPASRSR